MRPRPRRGAPHHSGGDFPQLGSRRRRQPRHFCGARCGRRGGDAGCPRYRSRREAAADARRHIGRTGSAGDMISGLDTHETVKRLTAAGFTDAQAEAVTAAVKSAVDLDLSNLATKADLEALRAEFAMLRGEFAALRGEFGALRGEVGVQRAELEAKIERSKVDIDRKSVV